MAFLCNMHSTPSQAHSCNVVFGHHRSRFPCGLPHTFKNAPISWPVMNSSPFPCSRIADLGKETIRILSLLGNEPWMPKLPRNNTGNWVYICDMLKLNYSFFQSFWAWQCFRNRTAFFCYSIYTWVHVLTKEKSVLKKKSHRKPDKLWGAGSSM